MLVHPVDLVLGVPDESALRSILPPNWHLGRWSSEESADSQIVRVQCVAVIPEGTTGDELMDQLCKALHRAKLKHVARIRSEGKKETLRKIQRGVEARWPKTRPPSSG